MAVSPEIIPDPTLFLFILLTGGLNLSILPPGPQKSLSCLVHILMVDYLLKCKKCEIPGVKSGASSLAKADSFFYKVLRTIHRT